MTPEERKGYFDDVTLVGRAIFNCYQPDKLNYEILGNQEPHIHCHIFPRKKEDEYFRKPIWARPEDKSPQIKLTPQELDATILKLRQEIDRLKINSD